MAVRIFPSTTLAGYGAPPKAGAYPYVSVCYVITPSVHTICDDPPAKLLSPREAFAYIVPPTLN
jgi:hypothetical protein